MQQLTQNPTPPILTLKQLEISAKIVVKLQTLGCEVKFLPEISEGPVLSVYRVVPKGKTKVSEIENLAKDLAVFLGAEDIVVKRLPGESSVAIFVPNEERKFVKFQDCISGWYSKCSAVNTESTKWTLDYKIPLILGANHLGHFYYDDLSTLPHLLIAGTTGGGKSTLLTSLVAGMIYIKKPTELKLLIADTKGVEFTSFQGCSHITQIGTSIYEVLEMMDSLIGETERRLKLFSRIQGCKNIVEYNYHQKFSLERQQSIIPYICFVIDELADLLDNKSRMSSINKEEEEENESNESSDTKNDKRSNKGSNQGRSPTISKIASDYLGKIVQKSRATGIHCIAATQRPSVNIVQGSIKANFPARLTFRLPSQHDSRTVINTEGAEHLLSRGDMLYISPNKAGIARLHAPLVSEIEIRAAIEMSSFNSMQ
jgi:S-DNA-T family DNA segregation ATPase FtsK/SpoIIIE